MPGATPHVAILLCTKDGEAHLHEQLRSFTAQRHADWRLWVSDDGSRDGTLGMLARYDDARFDARNSLFQGPGEGVTRNFLSLLCRRGILARHFAFADQDDIWHPDKLAHAVTWLEQIPADCPALYCSRTRIIDEGGWKMGLSPLFAKPPAFTNALVQNLAGGNTMVINAAARELLFRAGENANPVAHDWWAYLLISGAGGRIFYDPIPLVCHRQHQANLVGAGVGMKARLSRLGRLTEGQYRRWTDMNIAALQRIHPLLTLENQVLLDLFAAGRRGGLMARLAGFRQSRVHRQTFAGNLSLFAGIIMGWI